MRTLILILLFPLLSFSQSHEKNDSNEELFTVFYNLENLFDTIDSPQSNDSEFLPDSKKQWNSYRYNHKLRQLGKVFSNLAHYKNNNNMPDIIGLCEVENRLVIEDLLKIPAFSNQDYTIVHQDSPDSRGIDCALLFSNKFKLLKYDFISIKNSNEKRPTRDIVYVKLAFKDEIINVFVNHWPSRWGGQEKSNYKRVYASKVLSEYIKRNTSDDEYSIIMGDFNDYPSNESISKLIVDNKFINLMTSKYVSGKGSYNYKGKWNWLDQILLSEKFNSSNVNLISSGSFKRSFMLYKNKNGIGVPNRTFGGDNWYGGFSDHLPVYFKFNFSN